MAIYFLSNSTLFITIHATDLHLKVEPIYLFDIDLIIFTQTIKSKTLITNMEKIKYKRISQTQLSSKRNEQETK